jgi:hypothetical protein
VGFEGLSVIVRILCTAGAQACRRLLYSLHFQKKKKVSRRLRSLRRSNSSAAGRQAFEFFSELLVFLRAQCR